MPMLKKYDSHVAQPQELKTGLSERTINYLLNYSKSLESKKIKQEKVLVHLN